MTRGRAGRHNPVLPWLDFPLGPQSPAPGPQHASIADAVEAADADGTRSILDLNRVADEPDFFTAARMPDEDLMEFFGTTRPTREQVEDGDFWEDLERGHGLYVVLYKDGEPDELFFAGYSFD